MPQILGMKVLAEFTTNKTHISNIQPGDTVIHNGKVVTVCVKDLKRGFCGRTLFGDSYRLGTLPVERIPELSRH